MPFTKRAEVIAYLVAEGKPLNYAKVAIDQGYNFDWSNDTSDLCRRMVSDEPEDTVWDLSSKRDDDDALALTVTKTNAIQMYNTFEEMLSIENERILVDGEAMYDLNGDPL